MKTRIIKNCFGKWNESLDKILKKTFVDDMLSIKYSGSLTVEREILNVSWEVKYTIGEWKIHKARKLWYKTRIELEYTECIIIIMRF